MSNPDPSTETAPRSQNIARNTEPATAEQAPVEAIQEHAEEHLIAMFGEPPTAPCTNDCGRTHREGHHISLAVSYTEETGVAESHAVHCRQCDLPDPEDFEYGDWAGFLTGTATPNDWVDNGGDCLLLTDVTLHTVQKIPDSQ